MRLAGMRVGPPPGDGAPAAPARFVLSRTPLRVSFAGGGTDLPAFYREEPGAVLGSAIARYIYIMVKPKFDGRVRASYAVTEVVDRAEDLRHELIRETLGLLGIRGGIEVVSISDIPSRGSGLGSSSAYTVGLLRALHALQGRAVTPDRLAAEACTVELERCGKPIGKQDQYLAALGGLRYLAFYPDGRVEAVPVDCSARTRAALEAHLLLLYTGVTRSADPILAAQCHNTVTDPRHRRTLRRMAAQARAMREALERGDVAAVGELLHEGWMAKRTLAQGITTPRIDAWYARARRAGAVGGKITGAGGGGFLLLFAPPERHAAIRRALPHLRPVLVRLEPEGSRVLYAEPGEGGGADGGAAGERRG